MKGKPYSMCMAFKIYEEIFTISGQFGINYVFSHKVLYSIF